ncbi:MAG: 16S rRNA (guanine(527)-N(7))-methyltransferase RsmG [Chitinivibrionales bacterium]|nr:16S rRNA (guanine(527)-N(7))-methyltransferase RsmG [Chitinivibrionales bacterium]
MNKTQQSFMSRAKKLYELKELERLGLTPDLEQRNMILAYMATLLKWNQAAGLVSKKDEENLFIRHFCDSLQPLLLFGFKKNARVLDVGAGGGFPSIPIRIFRPDLKMVLAESNKKKAKFLEEVIAELNIENAEVLPKRIDQKTCFPEKFDYIITRGVTTLQKFSSIAKMHVTPEGRMYTFKSRDFTDELEEITLNKDKEQVRISEIAEYDLGNQIFGLKLVSLERIN